MMRASLLASLCWLELPTISLVHDMFAIRIFNQSSSCRTFCFRLCASLYRFTRSNGILLVIWRKKLSLMYSGLLPQSAKTFSDSSHTTSNCLRALVCCRSVTRASLATFLRTSSRILYGSSKNLSNKRHLWSASEKARRHLHHATAAVTNRCQTT